MDPMFLKFLQSVGAIACVTDPNDEPGGDDPKPTPKPGEDDGGKDGDGAPCQPGKKALVAERSARAGREGSPGRERARQGVRGRRQDRLREDDSALEKLRADLADVTKERDELVSEKETSKLRTEVLDAKEVPERLRRHVHGSTKDELEASADEVLADFHEENPMRTLNPRKRDTTPKQGVSAGGDCTTSSTETPRADHIIPKGIPPWQ